MEDPEETPPQADQDQEARGSCHCNSLPTKEELDKVREDPFEKDFFETYLSYGTQTPDPDLIRQMSEEAIDLESRPESPCPPGSPPKPILPRMHQCPSVESFLKLGEPVHIHFSVLPGPKLFALEARLDRTILDVKNEISPICQVPAEFLELRKNNNLVMDHRSLSDIGARPRKKLKLTVELSQRCPIIYKINIRQDTPLEQKPPSHHRVSVGGGGRRGSRTVDVTVEHEPTEKVYLGGYRDKRCGILYYNAETQTPLDEKPIGENKEDAACQAFHETWKEVQTLKDQYQQTERRDYYLSQKDDRVVWPNLYMSSDFLDKKKVKAAIVIQKYWRRWLAIRERAERLNALLLRVEWAENVRKGRTEIRLVIVQDELRRQHAPTTMLDVELLYRAINDWRQKELEFIESNRWGPDRKAALAQVAEMELNLLADLEKAKSKIKKGLKEKVIEKAFRKMGNPARALNKTGNFMSWDTPSKFVSRQFAKMFYCLREPVTNVDERFATLEVLYDHIKWHDSMMTKYLIDLIVRELTLGKMNQPEMLVGVRKRIANAFYRLCRDPSFNPEAKRLQKTPFDTLKLRKDMVQCTTCRKVFTRNQFGIINGVAASNRCLNCTGIYRTSILRSDLNLYRYMLDELRNDEHEAKVENSVAYLIDVYDLQFLVEQLWHGQSALSGMDNRYLLRLCRWDSSLPWYPWNCVLLTEEEAVAHIKIQDMNAAYQPSFVEKVHVTHQAARIYFARLTALSIPLDPKMSDFCATIADAHKKKGGTQGKLKFKHR